MGVELLSARVMDRVPGWEGRTRTVEPLGGGITNRNYRVAVDGDVFVVRIPAETGSLLGIDRGLEHQASRLAAACGVGPEVIAFVEPEGVLVTRFIEGRAVTDEAVHQPAMLERIAQSLRRIHQSGSLVARFSAFRVVEAYALTTTRHGGQLPAFLERARPIAVDIERALPPEPLVPCHNDLLNANFIDDGATIRIVDWEYAGMGDRFFDLGNFAVNHQLTEEDEGRLLSAYFGRLVGSQYARLRLMRIMSDFREAMWGVLQQAISELDFDFAGYAGKHFDRLLTAARDPRYDDWLRQAAG
ncbi:MAG TPA: phosphotransferase [Candidatus Dormibacteraeota bacterium]|nr:phosphotransferase [Candidatus Dormibacteraeota bacterium]